MVIPPIKLTTPVYPLYAVVSILLLIVPAEFIRRWAPFYRRELQVEEKTRLTPLDGLRGLLCFGVMYHHAVITRVFLETGAWAPPSSVFCVLLGQGSMAFFFCITGYLFWSRAIARNGDIPAFEFYRGRWARIIPLYIFTCAVVLWLARKQIHWHHPDTHLGLARMALMGLNGWGRLHNVDIPLYNCGVVWSLQFEWIFYLAFPVVAPVVAGGGLRIIFLFIALKSIIGWYNPPDLTYFFLPGIIAAHIAQSSRVVQVLRSRVTAVPVMALILAMPLYVDSGYSWQALGFTTLIFIPIACGNSLWGMLNFAGLRLMGVISYSVYLLHGVALFTCRPWLKASIAQGDFWYWLHVFSLACIVLVACCITYRWIEHPFIQFEKRFRRKRAVTRNQNISTVEDVGKVPT